MRIIAKSPRQNSGPEFLDSFLEYTIRISSTILGMRSYRNSIIEWRMSGYSSGIGFSVSQRKVSEIIEHAGLGYRKNWNNTRVRLGNDVDCTCPRFLVRSLYCPFSETMANSQLVFVPGPDDPAGIGGLLPIPALGDYLTERIASMVARFLAGLVVYLRKIQGRSYVLQPGEDTYGFGRTSCRGARKRPLQQSGLHCVPVARCEACVRCVLWLIVSILQPGMPRRFIDRPSLLRLMDTSRRSDSWRNGTATPIEVLSLAYRYHFCQYNNVCICSEHSNICVRKIAKR